MAGDEGNDPSSFGSKPNVSACPLIPNIKTALFIQLAATSTVYEDYERNFKATISCVASQLCNVISPTRLGHWRYCPPTCTRTSAILHLFVRPIIPLSAEHGHGLSRSLLELWVNPF